MSNLEIAARHFNTAIITTKLPNSTDFTEQFKEISDSPAFHCILKAITTLAAEQNMSPEAAAEQVIQIFRKADKLWDNYIFYEGLEKLKSKLEVSNSLSSNT